MKRIVGAILVCGVSWLLCCPAAEPAFVPNKKVEQKVRFWLRDGVLTTSVGADEVTLKDLKPGRPEIVLNGVKFQSTSNGTIQIQSAADVSLESPDIKGWTAELPQNVRVSLQFDFEIRRVGITMPPQASRSVFLVCESGGKMEFKSGAKGQIDFFKNGSYLFRGVGDLTAANSDGQKFDFKIPGMTMSGGPLVLQKPAGGTEYWERSSPTVSLKISGTPKDDLQIRAGKSVVYKTGADHSDVKFEETDAKIRFTEGSDGSLSWKVEKGEFRISIEGIPGFIAIANSRDVAVMSWNRDRKMADIKNLSEDPIRVELPARSFAVVDPSAEFQFSLAAPGIFSAAAAGADVRLYNGNGVEISNLQAGNLLLNTKTLTAGLTSGNGLIMRLTWDNGVPLEVNADQLFAAVQPGAERVLKFGSDGIAKINYAAGGFLTIEAVRSNYKLIIEAVHGIEMELVEGDTVSLTLDLKKATFTVKADERNVNDVAVTTESGYSPVLEASRALNFNIGKDGALLASSGGQPLYFASGTGNSPTKGLNPPPPYNQNDTTGVIPPIQQPPVSVSGLGN